ncbi:unnamed protein product [Phytophthora fragariaefolia]|uniref:Unnamed protein product n=1 Tax=Phytophthora fragariaefolia TaxID=1490495 RepID=A0A9W6XCY7_9STRA|nr:unnamed protein product [Phytophthora fragariaefolia]
MEDVVWSVIFDIVDLEAKGAISTTDLVMCEFYFIFYFFFCSEEELTCGLIVAAVCGAVGRAIMKLFEYKVEPEQQPAMAYVAEVLDGLGVGRNGSIAKEALCKYMVADCFAVHYAKQCTGEGV